MSTSASAGAPRAASVASAPAVALAAASDGSGAGAAPRRSASAWPLERVLFALAGTMTLLSALLAAVVSPWFLLLTAFVGVNQWLFVAAGDCPASLILRRLLGLRSAIQGR